jgi:hypothetical protein
MTDRGACLTALSSPGRSVRCNGAAGRYRDRDAAAAAWPSVAPVDPGLPACWPLAGDLLVDANGDDAVQPAARRAHRRVAEDAPPQLAGGQRRARLLHVADARQGRAAAEDLAGYRHPRQAEDAREGGMATAHPAGVRPSASRRGRLEAEWTGGRRRPARTGDDVPDRAGLPAHRGVRRVVRPRTDRARVLPRPLRAAARDAARPDAGPLRPALAPARGVQQRLHLQRRPERGLARWTRERAAQGRSRHGRRLPERRCRHRGLARRPEARPGGRVRAPEPALDHQRWAAQPRSERTAPGGASHSGTRCGSGAPESGSTAAAT